MNFESRDARSSASCLLSSKQTQEVTVFRLMLDLEVYVLAEALDMNQAKTSVGRVESFKTSLAMQKKRLQRQTQVRLKK